MPKFRHNNLKNAFGVTRRSDIKQQHNAFIQTQLEEIRIYDFTLFIHDAIKRENLI